MEQSVPSDAGTVPKGQRRGDTLTHMVQQARPAAGGEGGTTTGGDPAWFLPPPANLEGTMTDLTTTQQAYIEWRADPVRVGTKTTWALEHEVNITTLRAWEKTQWYQDGLTEALNEMALGTDSIMEVLHSIQRAAASGDQAAAKTYLAWADKINPQREAPRDAREIEQLTDEELELAWVEARAS